MLIFAVAAGCATSRDETWIGKNVGVVVDSSAETKPATQPADAR